MTAEEITPVETTAEEATAERAAATTAGATVDALTRIGCQNPVAPYARFVTATTPRPNAPCPCAQNAL